MADLINLTALAAPTSIGGSSLTTTLYLPAFGTKVLSGALTGGAYTELVSLSVPGWLRFAAIATNDATSRTMGLKIVIDGTDVYDVVSSTISTNEVGFAGVGNNINSPTAGASGVTFESFRFNSSLSLQVKSSLSETDKILLIYLVAT